MVAKILLFCPTYERDGLDEFWPDSEDSFNALIDPPGVKVKRVISRDNPFPLSQFHRYRNTLHQFQKARAMALDGKYDALCTFESDMLVPPDGLIKLWQTPADVVYGLYVLRHGSNVVNAFRWMNGSPNIDQSLSLFPEEYKRADTLGEYRVSGCGNGFTLIRRAVLERFEMRQWDTGIGASFAPDWALASDCQAAGIEQVCRFDLKCGHIDDNGHILWPGRDDFSFYRVRVLQDFTGNDGFGSRPFKAGTEAEILGKQALEFARAGFVTMIEDAAQPATARPRRKVEA